jgi:hypothetical protein
MDTKTAFREFIELVSVHLKVVVDAGNGVREVKRRDFIGCEILMKKQFLLSGIAELVQT